MRRQFWVALVAGCISAVLAVVTLISREWIEIVFNVDPDGGNGGLEWGIVFITAVIAIVSLGWARIEWRRAHPVALGSEGHS